MIPSDDELRGELFEKLLERLEAEAANDRYMTVFNRSG